MQTPAIYTERLILGPLRESDANAFHEYRSQSEVARYQSWAPRSLEEALLFIQSFGSTAFDTPGSWFQLAVRLRESGILVGDVGVRFLEIETRQAELGFTVAPSHQQRGFGTEAVVGLLDHLFKTLRKHRVFASVDPRNLASMALLKRVGMRQEAHFRESQWLIGEWADDVIFAVLESEWTGG